MRNGRQLPRWWGTADGRQFWRKCRRLRREFNGFGYGPWTQMLRVCERIDPWWEADRLSRHLLEAIAWDRARVDARGRVRIDPPVRGSW